MASLPAGYEISGVGRRDQELLEGFYGGDQWDLALLTLQWRIAHASKQDTRLVTGGPKQKDPRKGAEKRKEDDVQARKLENQQSH